MEMENKKVKLLMSAKDICAYASVSRTTLWRWVRDGKMTPPQKLGSSRFVRWKKEDVDRCLLAMLQPQTV